MDYDAIVIGAGHNGLDRGDDPAARRAAHAVLEKNKYAGGMASTVELWDGYHFEIAGSVLFPPAPAIVADLGLDAGRRPSRPRSTRSPSAVPATSR